jgi:hypothetical protein
MWIFLFNALDEFGIKEINDVVRVGGSATALHNHLQIELTKRKTMDEALHSALRIAGLVSSRILISNRHEDSR